MDLVGSWLRRAMVASLVALVVPVAVLIALIATLGGGGLGGLGSLGQLFTGPSVPLATSLVAGPPPRTRPVPVVPPGSLVASVPASSGVGNRQPGRATSPVSTGSPGETVLTTLSVPPAVSTGTGGGSSTPHPTPGGSPTKGLGSAVVAVTGGLGQTVAGTGAALGQTTDHTTGAVGGILTPVSQPLAALVSGAGSALGGTLTGTGAAAGGLVAQLGNVLGQALGAGSQ